MNRVLMHWCACAVALSFGAGALLGQAGVPKNTACPPCDTDGRTLASLSPYYTIDASTFKGGLIPAAFSAAVQAAVNDWNDQPTCYKLTVSPSFGQADIVFGNQMLKPGNCGSNSALASWPAPHPETIVLDWNQVSYMATLPDGPNNLKLLLEHEIGHSFGLLNAYGCKQSTIMSGTFNRSCVAIATGITQADVMKTQENCIDPSACDASGTSSDTQDGDSCPCVQPGGSQFLGSTQPDGSCSCTCSQPCDVSNTYGCDSGEYCVAPDGAQQGCCTECNLPCGADDESCWCAMYSDYCTCIANEDMFSNCGGPPWLDDYPAACFPDAPGCPDGVVTCHYGAAQCAGTGKGCDSNGCCTLTGSSCQLPGSFNNGQCPVDWVQVGDCCEAPCNYSCNVDSDCASVNGICVGGCCGCVPGYNFSGGAPTCGPCGQGLLQCDGTCQETDCVCNAGQSCGNCGTMGCGGWCEDPCPYMPGSPCGGCGTSNGFGCEDPCDGCATQYTGQGCGNCGTMRCNGTCDDPCACIENMGDSCGYCGNLQCSGQCDDPCNGCSPQVGQGCGNCGTIDCNGNCDDSCS